MRWLCAATYNNVLLRLQRNVKRHSVYVLSLSEAGGILGARMSGLGATQNRIRLQNRKTFWQNRLALPSPGTRFLGQGGSSTGCPLSGVAAMKEIIDGMGATYGPEALKVIGKAFDDAWAEIGPGFSKNGLQAQSARMTLANAILEVATEDSRDADELKNAALQAMALAYRADPQGLPGYLAMRDAGSEGSSRRQ
jgi:hypothetical protein